MSQAPCERDLAAGEMLPFHCSPYWIRGKGIGSGTALSQNNSAFPCQYHPFIAHHPLICLSPALYTNNNNIPLTN